MIKVILLLLVACVTGCVDAPPLKVPAPLTIESEIRLPPQACAIRVENDGYRLEACDEH